MPRSRLCWFLTRGRTSGSLPSVWRHKSKSRRRHRRREARVAHTHTSPQRLGGWLVEPRADLFTEENMQCSITFVHECSSFTTHKFFNDEHYTLLTVIWYICREDNIYSSINFIYECSIWKFCVYRTNILMRVNLIKVRLKKLKNCVYIMWLILHFWFRQDACFGFICLPTFLQDPFCLFVYTCKPLLIFFHCSFLSDVYNSPWMSPYSPLYLLCNILRSFPTPFPTNFMLVTIDVTSLYTNIPHAHGLSAIEKFLSRRPSTFLLL